MHKYLLQLLSVSLLFCFPVDARAQGLLWSLPEQDGVWVRYFGDLKQIQERPDSAQGPLEMTWQSELTIKALASEEAEYRGKNVRCRWLEFKHVTGHQSATGIDAGPYGTRIYKVLVPEEAVTGKILDDRQLPVILVPVLKGFLKYGNKPAQPVKDKVLTFYPLLGLFSYYPSLKSVSDADENITLPQLGDVAARHYTGVEELQSATSRSKNEGEIWVSSAIPFGWASYKAHVIREQKDRLAPEDAFKKHTELQIVMSAVEKGEDARSELTADGESADPKTPETSPAEAPVTETPAEPATPEEKPVEPSPVEPSPEEPGKPAATNEPPAEPAPNEPATSEPAEKSGESTEPASTEPNPFEDQKEEEKPDSETSPK